MEARSQARLQQSQIDQLENQLKQQTEENRRAQSRSDTDINAGLTSTVFIAFGILVAVNAFVWVLCIGNRAGKRHRGRPSRTNGRSYRGKDKEGLDV